MKRICIVSILLLLVTDCFGALKEVTFEWFNLSTNEIFVTDTIGLPNEASPGRLTPNRTEDQLEVSGIGFSETVYIKDRIVIKWNDNGKDGFHGDFGPPGIVLPGIAHKAEFKREDLGLPAKLESGKIRFTYLGNDKWRIKLFPTP
jgi:hypothetical protein